MAVVLVKKRKVVEVPEAFVCDGCSKRLAADGEEAQEMLRWAKRGGYASICGDGEDLSLDLCQECVQRLLGAVLQHHGNGYSGDSARA